MSSSSHDNRFAILDYFLQRVVVWNEPRITGASAEDRYIDKL
jgi:hypothetical protein